MSHFSDYTDTVVASIGNKLAERLKACKALAGLLETTELSALHQQTPAVFVAMAGTGEMTYVETEEQDTVVRMVAYLLVVNSNAREREFAAQELIPRLLVHIAGQQWGLSYAHPASAIESQDLHGLAQGFKSDTSSWRTGVSVLARAADLYGGDSLIKNLAIWAVTWEQKLRIGTDAFAAEPAVPTPTEVFSTMHGKTSLVITQATTEG
ncbi:MAG TPA: hypothetical protein DDY14_05130 [Chromatiaceae bacterium]|jgi:hypothetical protein|nr:MAG: hypothetical protein N838_03875 [Thiohalocapsa sp. PB-PSB1]HBG94707.1 hypothetical protein [Chromatiaceae bacterium]HCS90215.1 hypothetical protein [Chromatiaceae bacterium]